MIEDKQKGCSYYGKPAKGCRYCVKGEKLVLFITGLCGQRCFYCPISELKFGKDIVFANEWKIEDDDELFEEIKMTEAKGAGITGGDPLVTVEKTCRYIRLLKEKMGEKFHIHLYTPLKLVNKKNLRKLHEAGLDEIRFHPNLDKEDEWLKMELASNFRGDSGIEIPCLSEKEAEIKKLLLRFSGKLKFMNLNELEYSDTEVKHFQLKGKTLKNSQSYAIKGSEETAQRIIKYAEKNNLDMTVYYCSAKLKDRTQLGNRIKRRAKKVKKEYDIATKEGTLIRGVVYLEELKPGFDYRKKLSSITVKKKEIKNKLEEAYKKLDELSIKKKDIDFEKFRITIPRREAKKNSKKLKKEGLVPAIVEEYATKDSIEVEIEFL